MVEVLRKADDVLHRYESEVQRFEREVQPEVANLTAQLDKAKGDLEMSGILDRIEFGANENKISVDNGHFKGWRELKVVTPYDRSQIKKLLEALKQIPSVKLEGEAGTEENYSIYLNITEPIPLPNILKNLSLVESSDDRGNTIIIRLKHGNNSL